MKLIGNILVSLGTVLALVAGARIPPVVWVVTAGLIILVAGAILKQLAARRARTAGRADESLPDLLALLEGSAATLIDLDSRAAEMDDKHLLSQVDELLKGPLYLFAEGRHSLASNFGTSGYNGVMEHFSRGERYLNRVWSALVDGYGREARDYLNRSAETINQAKIQLENLAGNKTA